MTPVEIRRLLLLWALMAALNACGRPLPRPGEPVVPRSAVSDPLDGLAECGYDLRAALYIAPDTGRVHKQEQCFVEFRARAQLLSAVVHG